MTIGRERFLERKHYRFDFLEIFDFYRTCYHNNYFIFYITKERKKQVLNITVTALFFELEGLMRQKTSATKCNFPLFEEIMTDRPSNRHEMPQRSYTSHKWMIQEVVSIQSLILSVRPFILIKLPVRGLWQVFVFNTSITNTRETGP